MTQSRNTISVIVTAYERPMHLWFTLLGLQRQSAGFEELIIADDGSGQEVQTVIARFASRAKVRTVHVCQGHQDCRRARSRNNAIRAATGDYLVFLDQDCLPSVDFLKAHVSSPKTGVFRVGSCVFLNEAKTEGLREEDILTGRFEALLDETETKKLRKAQRNDNFYAFFRRHLWPIKFKPKLRGGNFSIHKADLLKVNGFDENFVGWGQEDDDLGRRLYLAGMMSESVVASAVTFHLHHPPPPDGAARWRDGRNVQYYLRKNVPAFAEKGVMTEDGRQPEDVKVTICR